MLGRDFSHQEGREDTFQGLSVKSQDSISLKCIDPQSRVHRIGGGWWGGGGSV